MDFKWYVCEKGEQDWVDGQIIFHFFEILHIFTITSKQSGPLMYLVFKQPSQNHPIFSITGCWGGGKKRQFLIAFSLVPDRLGDQKKKNHNNLL